MASMASLSAVSTAQRIELLHSKDLDEARQLVTSVFCEHRLEAIASHSLDYRHGHLRTGHLSFSQIGYGAEVTIDPGALEQFYLVQLPFAGHDLLCIDGRELHSDPRYGSVHAPGEELQMRWSDECRKLVVRFERSALEAHAAELFGHSLHKPIRFHSAMNLEHPANASWRNTARHVFAEMQRCPHLFDLPMIRSQFEQTLMTMLLTLQPHDLHNARIGGLPRVLPRHVKLACDFMESHPEQAITVSMLVEVSGVSGRSLFAGFERFLDMSPMRYLRDVRLERVRQDLLDCEQPRGVTQIATRWGFLQLGRMAADYRKRYGESPRETLARSR